MAKKGKKKRSKRSGQRSKQEPKFRSKVGTELVDQLLYRFIVLGFTAPAPSSWPTWFAGCWACSPPTS